MTVFLSIFSEIAPNIKKGVITLKENFIHRVLVFSISGTYIVDLKDNVSPAAKISSRLLPDYLADFLSTMVKMTQRKLSRHYPNAENIENSDPEVFKAKDSFMNNLSLTLFNLTVQVVYNDVMAVATFSSIPECVDVRKDSQLLATKYFFSQFWCEFTSEVLIEFFHEDVIYRQ